MQLSTGIDAFVHEPEGEPLGGIVVIQEIFGVNAHIRDLVERLADAGYLAVAPAVFDHIHPGIELGYDQQGFDEGRKCIQQVGLDVSLDDVAAAASTIAHAGKVGTVGFCWGGTVAMLAAQRLGLPSVSFYGARNVPFLDQPFKAPVQFHFGELDKGIPPDMVAAHRSALPDMEIFTYPEAGHGFNCDRRDAYHAPSAALAWQRTLTFFRQQLV
jgi:carboxymethylenebutenolidase